MLNIQSTQFNEHKESRLFYFKVANRFVANKAETSLNCSGCNECRDGCYGRCRTGSPHLSISIADNPCEGCDGCGTRCNVKPF